MIFTQAKRHHTQKYTYMTTNHDIIFPPEATRNMSVLWRGSWHHIPPQNNKKYVCTVARIMTSYSPPSWFSRVLHKETNAVSNTRLSSRSRHKPNKTKNSPSARSPSPSMLHPPPCSPAVKREIQTENCFYPPRTPPVSFPRIKGSQQCSNTGCFPP